MTLVNKNVPICKCSFVQNLRSPKVLHRLLWNFDTTLHLNRRVWLCRYLILYRVIHVAHSLETFWFPKIVWIWKSVADYNGRLQVQIKYFPNGDTSGITGNRRHLCFFKWKGLILISNFDFKLNFEFRISFCQHLSVIVFD
jgi:hypothetical protein